MKYIILNFFRIRKEVKKLLIQSREDEISEIEEVFKNHGANKEFFDWLKEYGYSKEEMRKYLKLLEER